MAPARVNRWGFAALHAPAPALLCALEAEMLATRILPGVETKALYGATVVEPPALGDREAGDRGSISFLDTQGLEAEGEEATGEESAESAEARQEKRSSLDSQYPNMAPPGTDGDTPVTMPPRAQRMSQSVPKDVYGNDRASKVLAPEVSLTAATANPNMRNLLLEVPYKRGVRTTSVNQRYLTHEQTFDAAFVRSPSSSPSPSPVYPSTPTHTLPHPHLPRHRPHRLLCRPPQEMLPSEANFGTLKAGSLYRLKLKLVNVSSK